MNVHILLAILFTATYHSLSDAALTITSSGMDATVSNGYYTIKFSGGYGKSLVIGGKELIGPAKGFYCSINGGDGFTATKMTVEKNTADEIDIRYDSSWGELHYVARNGVNGIYSYFISGGIGTVGEFRTLYRFDGSIFRNGMNAEREGGFPTAAEVDAGEKLQDETWRLPNGQVYTKYDWVTYWSEDEVHGVYGNGHGVWMITASREYLEGGPMKEDLMVQGGAEAIALNYMHSGHGGTPEMKYPSGKIFGPWLVYFNDGSTSDAKSRAKTEIAAWPYSWMTNSHYTVSRSTVTGTIKLADGRAAAGAWVVLGKGGGDIYTQGADYIYYKNADSSGSFSIPHVRTGSYSLYAFANGGAIGDVTQQLEKDSVSVSGSTTSLGTLTWSPPKHVHLLFQIGTSDRKCQEFNLGSINRAYGINTKVPADLTYTVGSSKASSDWYYAQTKTGTWTIKFNANGTFSGTAHLTIAKAGQSRTATVAVSVNGKSIGNIPSNDNDQTIYRSGNRGGYYHLHVMSFPASDLQSGANTVTLHATSVSDGGGIMYDTILLETD